MSVGAGPDFVVDFRVGQDIQLLGRHPGKQGIGDLLDCNAGLYGFL